MYWNKTTGFEPYFVMKCVCTAVCVLGTELSGKHRPIFIFGVIYGRVKM